MTWRTAAQQPQATRCLEMMKPFQRHGCQYRHHIARLELMNQYMVRSRNWAWLHGSMMPRRQIQTVTAARSDPCQGLPKGHLFSSAAADEFQFQGACLSFRPPSSTSLSCPPLDATQSLNQGNKGTGAHVPCRSEAGTPGDQPGISSPVRCGGATLGLQGASCTGTSHPTSEPLWTPARCGGVSKYGLQKPCPLCGGYSIGIGIGGNRPNAARS